MGKIGVTLLLLAFSGVAAAQSVYKCRDAKGGAVYQSEPCPNAEKRWDAKPDPVPTYEQQQAAQLNRQRQEAESAQLRHAAGRDRRSGPVGASLPAYAGSDPDRCARAKKNREDTLQRVGLKRTFQLLRDLDDQVYNACK